MLCNECKRILIPVTDQNTDETSYRHTALLEPSHPAEPMKPEAEYVWRQLMGQL